MVIGRSLVKRILRKLDFELVRISKKSYRFPVELSKEECAVIEYVLNNNLTMVSFERLLTTLMACKYAILNSIPGDFVECGVWRGGNAIVAAEVIKLQGSDKHVWLYDTFAGMTPPSDADMDLQGVRAFSEFNQSQRDGYNEMYFASLDDVQKQFELRGLLGTNIHFVRGDVAETLTPNQLPMKSISVLRLDTDWYESTKREMETLYPILSEGGCLIIDDYGHWQGSQKAVDEYFVSIKINPYLQYIDYTGRICVKQH
jgi:O-methyltransferase